MYKETTFGTELIRLERIEQLKKHRFTIDHDKQYRYGELTEAAQYAITVDQIYFPPNMDHQMVRKLQEKNRIHQLAVAGALIAAEIDRLNNEGIDQKLNCNE